MSMVKNKPMKGVSHYRIVAYKIFSRTTLTKSFDLLDRFHSADSSSLHSRSLIDGRVGPL
jgi:hypothetical protein